MGVISLAESLKFAEAAKPAEGPGRFRIRVISAGVGSSGVYPAEALKLAAAEGVFKAGTHVYIDHPSESEAYDRPERSVRDIAGRLVTDAVYVDEDGGALDAEIEVITAWRATIAELLETIGMSIRARAEVKENDAQGRPVISRITEALSVDFVTHAGRGGKVLQLIESARTVTRAVQRGIAEATANDRREQLAALVRAAHGDEGFWTYVRDFDASTVWFEVSGPESTAIYAQTYAVTDDVATALTGDPAEVRATTTYVPVGEAAAGFTFNTALERLLAAAPLTTDAPGLAVMKWLNEAAPRAGIAPWTPLTESTTPQTTDADPVPVSEAARAAEPTPPAVEAGTPPPHTKEEAPMGHIQVDEARYAGLEEKAALVPALEAKVEAAEARAVAAEAERDQAVAASKARDFARKLAAEANKDLVPASLDAIVAEATRNPLPLDAERRLDTEKFGEVVNEARRAHETLLASIAEASGVGTVRGVGQTGAPTTPVSEADVDQAVARAFGRKGA